MIKNRPHIGIDATNIQSGGGLTHLTRLLSSVKPGDYFERITIWGSESTLNKLPEEAWLKKISPFGSRFGIVRWLLGQHVLIPLYLKREKCDILFSPGGILPIWCPVPTVTMSQNMLPFQPGEALHFGYFSRMRLKMAILRIIQGVSFKKADGLIFLTKYARDEILDTLKKIKGQITEIPHGIEKRFLQSPRNQRKLNECTLENPFRILYVSILMPYKHQLQVAHAITQLRNSGLPIEIQFVGATWGDYGDEFLQLLKLLDPEKIFLKWFGHESFENLHRRYYQADTFIFASSCENLPNILIEAMGAGLPIACSDRGPMPEVLMDAGVYFDPEKIDSIADSLCQLLKNEDLRNKIANRAYSLAQKYSWQLCAKDTFEFIAQIAHKGNRR